MLNKCCSRGSSNPVLFALHHRFPIEFLGSSHQGDLTVSSVQHFPTKCVFVAVDIISLLSEGWWLLRKSAFGHSDLKRAAERLCLFRWHGLSWFFRKPHLSVVAWVSERQEACYEIGSGGVVKPQRGTEEGCAL